jgi:dipeptidyl aminopeptidase/acylaminoacyl peptidase
VKPADLAALQIPGRPAIAGDGTVVVAVATPDLAADLYRGTLLRLSPAGGPPGDPASLTLGPRDSDPVISPDGRQLIFRRAPESGPAQLHLMPLDGGEPRKLTDHPLGAGPAVFAPDGGWIAYCAAVPEAGRYGTEEKVGADAEPPRRITRLAYRHDGDGFVIDKPQQVFLLDPAAGGSPVQLTDEPAGAADPTFTGDGRLLYVRSTGIDALTDELAVLALPDGAYTLLPGAVEPACGDTLIVPRGSAALPVVDGGTVFYLGVEFTGFDAVGRTTAVWSAPLDSSAPPLRMTAVGSVDVDRAAGQPQVMGGHVLVGVLHRGSTSLRAVPIAAADAPLSALPELIGGPRVVRSFVAGGDAIAAVVADGATSGEVVTVGIGPSGAGTGEARLSDFGAAVAATGLRPAIELTTSSSDGYPVHGWLVLPDGAGPHPVLLVVHGGPHAAYTPAVFDEAQVYAGAGYAVVMGNPRGSAGYGQEHGRAVVGALGTVDIDDLLALLDHALQRADCDAARVGVMGGSYGGFVTSWLCSHLPGRFAAAISERAVNAWDSFAGSSDIGYYFARAYVGADRETQWRTSPLAYADRIDTPLLIIHSEQDWRCPIEQGQRLYVALRERGAEVEMLLFPGEGHELSRSGRPRHRLQRFEAILRWWARFLPVP